MLDHGQNALPTIQWYNENVSSPVYTKGVVNKSNITNIQEREEAKVKAIKKKLRGMKPRAINEKQPEKPEVAVESRRAQQDKAKLNQVNSMAQRRPSRRTSVAPSLTKDLATPEPGPAAHEGESALNAENQTEVPKPTPHASKSVMQPPANSVSPPRLASIYRPSFATVESLGIARDKSLSESRILQTQVNSSFPEVEQTQTPRIVQRKRPISSTLLEMELSQVSNSERRPSQRNV
ncbi:hypothetical protein N0V88_003942 [Collariella sp. IMI 366227]|nr:hypothetical protein N0V88_003942 [Collariella sp. IMI 366227]